MGIPVADHVNLAMREGSNNAVDEAEKLDGAAPAIEGVRGITRSTSRSLLWWMQRVLAAPARYPRATGHIIPGYPDGANYPGHLHRCRARLGGSIKSVRPDELSHPDVRTCKTNQDGNFSTATRSIATG